MSSLVYVEHKQQQNKVITISMNQTWKKGGSSLFDFYFIYFYSSMIFCWIQLIETSIIKSKNIHLHRNFLVLKYILQPLFYVHVNT